MKDFPLVPLIVDDDEFVDRVVFEPSFFDDGKLSPTAYTLRYNEKYISVQRDRYCKIEDVVQSFTQRPNGDVAIGYARLITKGIRAISSPFPADSLVVSVEAKPSVNSPAHAGISMLNNSSLISQENGHALPVYLYVRKELVNLSRIIYVERERA